MVIAGDEGEGEKGVYVEMLGDGELNLDREEGPAGRGGGLEGHCCWGCCGRQGGRIIEGGEYLYMYVQGSVGKKRRATDQHGTQERVSCMWALPVPWKGARAEIVSRDPDRRLDMALEHRPMCTVASLSRPLV
jgi:hypothetical protein